MSSQKSMMGWEKIDILEKQSVVDLRDAISFLSSISSQSSISSFFLTIDSALSEIQVKKARERTPSNNAY